MTWTTGYQFADPFIDLRADSDQAETLRTELVRELVPGHPLHNVGLRVVARALPQDEVVVESMSGQVALVHLTWSGKAESPPWPTTQFIDSAEQFEQTVASRY